MGTIGSEVAGGASPGSCRAPRSPSSGAAPGEAAPAGRQALVCREQLSHSNCLNDKGLGWLSAGLGVRRELYVWFALLLRAFRASAPPLPGQFWPGCP